MVANRQAQIVQNACVPLDLVFHFSLQQLACQLPMFLYLLRPSQAETLTVKKVTHLLKTEFSEEGTNSRKFENAVYSQFLKYLREVASKIYLK